MTKEEIQLKLNELYKHFIPDVLDSGLRGLMRLSINQAFIFGIEVGEDEETRMNALEIIHEWEHEFGFEEK